MSTARMTPEDEKPLTKTEIAVFLLFITVFSSVSALIVGTVFLVAVETR